MSIITDEDTDKCEKCIYKAPLGYSRDCTIYNSLSECPNHWEEEGGMLDD